MPKLMGPSARSAPGDTTRAASPAAKGSVRASATLDATAEALGSGGARPASAASGPGVQRTSRSPQTREMLARLRRQLAQIHPRPANPHEARQEILNALERASLGDWSIPALTDDATTQRADGSVCIALLAHAILINAHGAFRIVDLLSPQITYFELAGRDGRAFTLPPGTRLERGTHPCVPAGSK